MGRASSRYEKITNNEIGTVMKKILLVIYDPLIENDVLKDRIKLLGRSYVFWNNHWLVETNLTPEEAYHKIIDNGFENQSIFVSVINSKPSEGYWGMMNKALWSWLKNE